MKKNLAKVFQYMTPEMQKNADLLERIRRGTEKAEMGVEKVEEILNTVTT